MRRKPKADAPIAADPVVVRLLQDVYIARVVKHRVWGRRVGGNYWAKAAELETRAFHDLAAYLSTKAPAR